MTETNGVKFGSYTAWRDGAGEWWVDGPFDEGREHDNGLGQLLQDSTDYDGGGYFVYSETEPELRPAKPGAGDE